MNNSKTTAPSFPNIANAGAGLFALALGVGLAVGAPASAMAQDGCATADALRIMQGFPPPPDLRVDATNGLFGVPYNRWSYQNMRTIWPSANVPAAPVATPLRIDIDGGIERLTTTRGDGTEIDLETYFCEEYVDALVVVHGGAIVFERYLNGMTADQPHQMMSVTKSFAGLFGLMAVHDGSVSEDDRIADIIPELANSGAFGGATFGQVLNMTNSMDFSEDYADPESGIQQYGRVLGLLPSTPDNIPADNIYDYLATLGIDDAHPHGEIFHYQTPKTDVVNWVTNRVTGQSFQDALYDVLWSRLGTEGETYVLLDRNGTLFAGGGLNATPHNLARFAMMMVNDGVYNGEQVVPVEVVDQLEAGADREAFAAGPDGSGMMADGTWSYRAQFWVRGTPGREAFMAMGIHGQLIYIDRAHDVAVVLQSSRPVSLDAEADDVMWRTIDVITDYLTGA